MPPNGPHRIDQFSFPHTNQYHFPMTNRRIKLRKNKDKHMDWCKVHEARLGAYPSQRTFFSSNHTGWIPRYISTQLSS